MEHLAAATSPDHSTCAELVLPPDETLLPRLLSLLDPTLPIIIFSSTHCTDLISPFRDYGNIITKFRKPILTCMNRDWSGVVKGLRADFENALEQASGILKVRQAGHGIRTIVYGLSSRPLGSEQNHHRIRKLPPPSLETLSPIFG